MSSSVPLSESGSAEGISEPDTLSGKKFDGADSTESVVNDQIAEDEAQKEIKTSSKSYPHVPPRVDAENYQAELPELLMARPSQQNENIRSLYYSPAIINDPQTEERISGFIAAVRNIFDADKLQNSYWSNSLASIPLESDEAIFRYLSHFNFDTEAAMFNIECFLSYGKDVVQIQKTADAVEKLPVGFVWSEYKDRVLPFKTQSMLGAFQTTRVAQYSDNAIVSATTTEEPQLSVTPVEMLVEESIPNGEVNEEAATAALNLNGGEENGNSSAPATVTSDRVLGSRQASDIKSEKALLKKSWQAVHRSVDELLNRAVTQCPLPSQPAPLSTAAMMEKLNNFEPDSAQGETELHSMLLTLAPSKRHGAPRATMEEALALLEEAARLPPYINSPGESVGETIRTMLGELLKYVMEARVWVAEVKDALHGPARKDQATTLAQLRRLLKQGEDGLRVVPLQDLQSFRRVFSEAKLLSKEGKYLIGACAAYFARFSSVNKPDENANTGETDTPVNDGEEEDDDELDRSKKGGRNRASDFAAKEFSVDHLKFLIDRFECLPTAPVLRRELKDLKAILAESEKLSRDVSEVVAKSTTFAVRKFKQPSENITRFTLENVSALLNRVEAFPVVIPEVDALQQLYSSVIDWKDEVRALFSDTVPTNSRQSRSTPLQQNSAKAVNLKKVETLLETGEKLLFEVDAELSLLRDRRLQAKAWLERLKKSFQTKTGSRTGTSRRAAAEGQANAADKLNLWDMKMMVEEGATMFEDEEGEDGRRATTQVRELSKAQSVVEIAEEWLARMRDLINSDVDANGNIVTPVRESPIEGENGDDADDEPEVVNLREMLREMLREADGMPVQMDEVQVLRNHLQALDWAEKMRQVLPVPAALVSLVTAPAENQPTELEPHSIVHTLPNAGTSAGMNDVNKPTFAKIVELAAEIKRIRAHSVTLTESFYIRPIPEEVYCMQVVSTVDHWIQQVRRLLLGNSVKKGIKLSRLIQLYHEGTVFPVRVTSECRPLVTAITAAENWIHRHRELLLLLNIPVEFVSFTIPPESDPASKSKAVTDSSSVPMDAESGEGALLDATEAPAPAVIATEDLGDTTNGVKLDVLSRAVRSAENVAADFPEIKAARDRLIAAEAWLQQVYEKCPAKFLTSSASMMSTRRKSNLAQQTGLVPLGTTSGFSTELSVNLFKFSARNAAQLDELVNEGLSLRIDFADEIVALQQAIEECSKWTAEMNTVTVALDSDLVKGIAERYHEALAPPAGLLGMPCFLTGDHADYAIDAGTFRRLAYTEPNASVSSASTSTPAKVEGDIWKLLMRVRDSVLEHQQHSVQLGLLTGAVMRVNLYATALHWIQHARNIIAVEANDGGGVWSDIPIEVVDSLIKFGMWLLQQQSLSIDTLKALDAQYAPLSQLSQFNNVEAEVIETAPSPDTVGDGENVDDSMQAEAVPFEDENSNEPQEVGTGGGKRSRDGADNARSVKRSKPDHEDEGNVHVDAEAKQMDSESDDDEDDKEIDMDEEDEVDHEVSGLDAGARPKRAKKAVDRDTPEPMIKPAHPRSKPSGKSKKAVGGATAGGGAGSGGRKKPVAKKPEDSLVIKVPRKPKHLDLIGSADTDASGLNEYHKIQQLLLKWQKMCSVNADHEHVHMHDNMINVVDLWLRLLKLFHQRLKEANRWNNDARILLSRLENINVNGARSLAPELTRLLVAADAIKIQSKTRNQLHEQIQTAKQWTTKADAIVRQHVKSEYLSLDGLKEFIKTGEKLLGMLVLLDCCEGNTNSSTQATATAVCGAEGEAAAHASGAAPDDDEHAQSTSSRSVNSLNCVCLLQELRAELKRGKQWHSRLQATGADKGAAVAAEVLEPLLAEIDSICVDFSEQKSSLEQGTLRYCFCRQAYHGQMIGCEDCDDWFHLSCIGITKAQADKIDKYICLRCTVRQSFHTTAVQVAQVTNRWMSNDELLKWRELRRAKSIRRKVKEERDIIRYQGQINEITESVRARYGKRAGPSPAPAPAPTPVPAPPPVTPALSSPASSSSAAMDVEEGSSETAAPVVAPAPAPAPVPVPPPAPAASPMFNSEEMINEQTRPIREMIRVAQNNLQSAMDEEAALLKDLEVEKHKVPMVREWMQAMQGVLWPSNREDLEIGKPLEPPLSGRASSTSANRDEFSVVELGLDRGLLSEGMQKAHCAAVALNIHLIEDVVLVFEGFKWMSWLSLFLHALRRPLPTRALRLFIEAYKPLKLQDEKVTKMLQSWYQRACTWKSRARKVTVSKTLDTAKVTALVTEAFGIPFICRAKQQLKLLLEGANPSAALGSAAEGGSGSGDAQAGSSGKRGTKIPQSLQSSSTLSMADPVVYSSDEEKATSGRCVIRYPFAMSDYVAAAVPKPMWPVEKIPFPPIMVTAASNAAPQTQQQPGGGAPGSTGAPPVTPPQRPASAPVGGNGVPRVGPGGMNPAAGAGVGGVNPGMNRPVQYRKPGAMGPVGGVAGGPVAGGGPASRITSPYIHHIHASVKPVVQGQAATASRPPAVASGPASSALAPAAPPAAAAPSSGPIPAPAGPVPTPADSAADSNDQQAAKRVRLEDTV